MIVLDISTKNCIVTGKPAKVFCGHVVAETFGERTGVKAIVRITAGWESSEVRGGIQSDGHGCYGVWKPEDGLQVALIGSDCDDDAVEIALDRQPLGVPEGED